MRLRSGVSMQYFDFLRSLPLACASCIPPPLPLDEPGVGGIGMEGWCPCATQIPEYSKHSNASAQGWMFQWVFAPLSSRGGRSFLTHSCSQCEKERGHTPLHPTVVWWFRSCPGKAPPWTFARNSLNYFLHLPASTVFSILSSDFTS